MGISQQLSAHCKAFLLGVAHDTAGEENDTPPVAKLHNLSPVEARPE